MKKIIIVEDEESMHEIYKDFFKGEKRYEIELVSNSATALKKLKDEKYDLMILDIIMDPIPGDALFVYARTYNRSVSLPIIISSVLGKEELDKLNKFGNVYFLQKPLAKKQLLSKLDEILYKEDK